MEQEHRDALQASLHDICQDLDAEDVLPYLRSKGILQYVQVQEIMAITRKDMRSMKLIDTLAGPLAFKEFIYALEINKKEFLADKILAHLPSSSAHQFTQAELHDNVQQSLKQLYLTRFQEVYPFSLPFTFDIENTWVSLALKEESNDSQVTEDHANLLERAFKTVKMLIIEGDPASGKTSLVRRLAYEWAKEKQKLSRYNLVVYAEFREVHEKVFQSIADLVLVCLKKYLKHEDFERLALLMNSRQFCIEHSILVLLDGYDESSLKEQCSELSTYLFEKTITNPLLFNIVLTTRKGYLSNLKGRKGRFFYGEVLGFSTGEQKKKYISNHFSSIVNSAEKITAVHRVLDNNKNLDKLAETPLFLTFICLVHERIIDGTLLELYCNIIWWLLDRYQQDFPDRKLPNLFGFQCNSNDNFETIQDHYLQFPQLHSLGKMALNKLEDNVFQKSDFDQFNLKPIIEQVGLLRRESNYDQSFKLKTTFYFPHRTIQEFLAALYFFTSHENIDQWFPTDSIMNIYEMKEFEKFVLRIALSKQLPINTVKHKIYFERVTELTLDLTFDALNNTAGLNNKLLNWFISQCTNIQILEFNKRTSSTQISMANMFTFRNLTNIHSLTFWHCTFETGSQLSFINCLALNYLDVDTCEIKRNANIGFSKLPALNTLLFWRCTTDLKAWQLITDEITRSSVRQLKLKFDKEFNNEFLNHLQKCYNVEKIEISIGDSLTEIIKVHEVFLFTNLINLNSLTFINCILEANSHISFTNCPSLKTLTFEQCEIESSTNIDFSKLPALDTLTFWECTIDLKAWQSITEGITRSSIICLKLSSDFFIKVQTSELVLQLEICKCVEKIEIFILPDISDEEQLTTSLSKLATEIKGLKRITFDSRGKRMKYTNMEIIKKAGQERDPNFKIGYAKETEEGRKSVKNDPDISLHPSNSTKIDWVKQNMRSNTKCTCL